jgi:hypothetical protein
MPEVNTICFSTRDAEVREDSLFKFRAPSGKLRTGNANRVSLGSCELPLTQRTIEKDWSSVFLSEEFHLKGGETLTISIRSVDGKVRESTVFFPPLVNEIETASLINDSSALKVRTKESHSLLSGVGAPMKCPIKSERPSGKCRLIGGKDGDLDLSKCLQNGTLSFQNERTFVINVNNLKNKGAGSTFLLVPPPSSIQEVCEWLEEYFRGTFSKHVFRFGFSAREDKVEIIVSNGEEGEVVTVSGSLASQLGVSSFPFRINSYRKGSCPSGQTVDVWGNGILKPGFYVPSHRPLCVSSPLDFCSEMDASLNGINFPSGDTTYQLVFSDETGRMFSSQVLPGRYTPSSFSNHLQDSMNTSVQGGGYVYFVSVVDLNYHCKFKISCVRKEDNFPSPFTILFHHPLCLDSFKLGFQKCILSGSSSYTSSTPVSNPTPRGKRLGGVVKTVHVPHEKKFAVHSFPSPSFLCVTVKKPTSSSLLVRTFVNGRGFSSGVLPGEVVRLCPSSNFDVVSSSGDTSTISPSPADIPFLCTCLVLCKEKEDEKDPSLLLLSVPILSGLEEIGYGLQISPFSSSLNLNFVRKGTILPHMVGFPPSCVIWGKDGSVANGANKLMPPFLAPFVYNLDHPDYVLITFSESNSSSFEHTSMGQSKNLFCKLSLYPLFREERMLPRDTTLFSGSTGEFTISFWNPDFTTPYKFNGAEFSFTLNFISE